MLYVQSNLYSLHMQFLRALNAIHNSFMFSFFQGNNLQRFCPREDCDLISRAPQSGCWPVYCNCGLVYCFHCGEEWHEPISCEVLKIWIKQSLEDTETYKWINSYTKGINLILHIAHFVYIIYT